MCSNLMVIPFIKISIKGYGFFILLSFFIVLFLVYKKLLSYCILKSNLYIYALYAVIGGLIGGRSLYLFTDFKYFFIDNPYVSTSILEIKIPRFFAFWQ